MQIFHETHIVLTQGLVSYLWWHRYAGPSMRIQGRLILHPVKNRKGRKISRHIFFKNSLFFTNLDYSCTQVVTGDYINQKSWYFHRTTVKQRWVWHFWGNEPTFLGGTEAPDPPDLIVSSPAYYIYCMLSAKKFCVNLYKTASNSNSSTRAVCYRAK